MMLAVTRKVHLVRTDAHHVIGTISSTLFFRVHSCQTPVFQIIVKILVPPQPITMVSLVPSSIPLICIAFVFMIASTSIEAASLRRHPQHERKAPIISSQLLERSLGEDQPEEERASQHFLQACGNRNSCLDGLECTSLGISYNRCLPPSSCTENGLASFQAQHYDLLEMQSQVFLAANITEGQLIQQLVDADSTMQFATSDAMKAVMRAINDVAIEPALQLLDVLSNCTTVVSKRSSQWDDDDDDEARDGVVYAGIHLEGGLLAQGSLDVIATGWPVTNDYEATFVRVCGGLELGGGGDLSLIVGKVMGSATLPDLQSIGVFAGIDVHAIGGMGIDVGVLRNGQEVIQAMAGVGAGIGAALQLCGAIKVSDSIL
jgi:hypothetical protein